MRFPANDPMFRSAARVAMDSRRVSALQLSTSNVLSAIFASTKATPARLIATAQLTNAGSWETVKNESPPSPMAVHTAKRIEVRSVYHPAAGAPTACQKLYKLSREAISA